MILFSVHDSAWMNGIISRVIGNLTATGHSCVIAAWNERAVEDFKKLGHREAINMLELYRKHEYSEPSEAWVRKILRFDWYFDKRPEGMSHSYESRMVRRCSQAYASARFMLKLFNPKTVVLWNNLSFGGSIFDILAEPDVRRIFIERGPLPNTIQFSSNGVNADLNLAHEKLQGDWSEKAKKTAALWMENYFERRDCGAWLDNERTRGGLPSEVAECKKPIALWASQVAYDTQIVHHSPLKHEYSKVYDLLRESWDANGPMQLVIKLHPQVEFEHMHDKARQIAGAIVVDKGDIRDYLSHPNVRRVATVNSSVGFEALLYGIPTVTLGRNWYTRLTEISQMDLKTFLNTPLSMDRDEKPWPPAVYMLTQGIDNGEFYGSDDCDLITNRISCLNSKSGPDVNDICDAIEGRGS